MANFDIAIPSLLKAEGGYVNHKHDKGKETNFGITIKKARKFGYKGEMKDLPVELAIRIYREKYWNKMRLDFINNQTLAESMFNFGVHCGCHTASKTLQRALNLLNRNNISWLDTIVDGIVGPKTRGIINSLSRTDILYTIKVLIGLQFEKYIHICEKDPTQEIFIRGWVNRISKLLKSLGE